MSLCFISYQLCGTNNLLRKIPKLTTILLAAINSKIQNYKSEL